MPLGLSCPLCCCCLPVALIHINLADKFGLMSHFIFFVDLCVFLNVVFHFAYHLQTLTHSRHPGHRFPVEDDLQRLSPHSL